MRLFGKAYLKKSYDRGIEAKNNNIDFIKAVANYDIECQGMAWEQYAMFKAGYNKMPFEPKEYNRYSDMNIDDQGYPERSVNHATNEPEDGVSVANEEWMKTFNALWMQTKNREIIKVTGIAVGTGSDGEIVIVPCKL